MHFVIPSLLQIETSLLVIFLLIHITYCKISIWPLFRPVPDNAESLRRRAARPLLRAGILVQHKLLRAEYTRWRDVPRQPTVYNGGRFHRSQQFGAFLFRTVVERESQPSRGADETAHRQGGAIVLYWWRGVRRMSKRLEYLRAIAELQSAVRLASGDRVQNTARLQFEDFQQSGVRSAPLAISESGIRGCVSIDADVYDTDVVCEGLGRRVQVNNGNYRLEWCLMMVFLVFVGVKRSRRHRAG